jgi:tRNA-2-methylthio-N6-dimethylallyladenosine synthase
VERIRFASPHPRHTGTRLIHAVRDLPKVCKHLHLPVQSGSTSILGAMRRRYSREDYLALVQYIHESIPTATLSTDIIVGFPGETEADFEHTLTLVETVRFSCIFSFKYSVRPNTLASRRLPDDVSEDVKSRRIVALQARQREIQVERHERIVGQAVEVMVDAVSRRRDTELSGRTSGNIVVNFPIPPGTPGADAWIGQLVPVAVRRAGAYSLWGEAVTADRVE